MNIYFYAYYKFYKIFITLKKELPEWFSSITLGIIIVMALTEILIAIFPIGFKKSYIIIIFILMQFLNYIILIRKNKITQIEGKINKISHIQNLFYNIIIMAITIVVLTIPLVLY